MKNRKGFVLSTYVYILLVFFLLLLGTMLAVLNNTKLLSNKLKDKTQETSGLTDSDYSFILLGNKEEITRVNEEYVDKGVKAQTTKGVDLTENVITENNVNINEIGDYEINYRVTYNGVTKKLTRIVHVVDNIGLNYLNSLYQYRNDENGLIVDNTEDENLRYAGSNDDVKNYVEFGNEGELWRIIGVFDTQTEEGGTEVARIKLVREDSIGNFSWDSSEDVINTGGGINQWGEIKDTNGNITYEGADLMRLLNGYYIGEEGKTCTYCNEKNQATCPTTNDCSSSVTPLNAASIKMTDKILWNIGGVPNSAIYTDDLNHKTVVNPQSIYNYERSNENVKLCVSLKDDGTTNYLCTDTVERTTIWNGLIALPYSTDYVYASSESACHLNMWDGYDETTSNWTNITCKNNNWMHYGFTNDASSSMYTLTNRSHATIASFIWYVDGLGAARAEASAYARAIRPSVYLKPNVKIIGGTGTETDPYKLSL